MFWTFKLKGFDNPSLPYETKDEGLANEYKS